ncbi:histidine kinase [Mucilaginibacter sp. UR6-1]|uniref:sensor histidine kinase n=1 Tax=Mucilaginibacter sp. UR6-1 TaxID=1435643 RepID=UPI001E3E1147|nr:histidine kinase [Mucilaginibacter sp. UR6-1]MCC8410565.1 histidine kinase [Mucilaginibacter sp. UR6-1]
MLKLINNRLKGFVLLEFWIVTGIIFVSFIMSAIHVLHISALLPGSIPIAGINGEIPDFAITYNTILIPVIFSYLTIFSVYLLLCFYVAPEFAKEDNTKERPVIFVFVLIYAAILFNVVGITYFALLLAIKIWICLFNRNKQKRDYSLNRDTAFLTVCWLFIAIGFTFLTAPGIYKSYVLFAMPAAIVTYLYMLYDILPAAKEKKRKGWYLFSRGSLCALASSIIIAIILFLFSQRHDVSLIFISDKIMNFAINEEHIAIISISSFFTQLIIAIPISRSVYKRRNAKRDEEITTLKTELGQSDANLNFLRSQINPHFLFNALNTLYGTALQENAERTGEGIQKLGDMMRLMLQENMKDKIALTKDIDYLNNYILLQKLRTATSANVVIEDEINNDSPDLLIAPMLLIPFVENAFKHGISLINPSFIKMKLVTSGNTLYFDVHNSIHLKSDSDPEKSQSGIGLENVKQRLNLLYSSKHELIIRETAKDFFIHLTLQLEEAV